MRCKRTALQEYVTKYNESTQKDLRVRKWQLTVTAYRHYECCGESHGKECLKRKVLRQPRKTDIKWEC